MCCYFKRNSILVSMCEDEEVTVLVDSFDFDEFIKIV
jgi:hypothetical protein